MSQEGRRRPHMPHVDAVAGSQPQHNDQAESYKVSSDYASRPITSRQFVDDPAISSQPAPVNFKFPNLAHDRKDITIGEALEATARSAGDKVVQQSDAAAIQATEARAAGVSETFKGGVASAAQSAAIHNFRPKPEEDKIKLSKVLANVGEKLPADKPVKREDATGIMISEARNNPEKLVAPGGVGESMAAAARLNQK